MLRSAYRGFTLLEVLASLVIVALLAGVCVPMLRSAAAMLSESRPPDASERQLSLESLADSFVKDHAAFGVASLDELTTAQITSPDADALRPVTVVRLVRDGEDKEDEFNHDWLMLRCGDHLAVRFRMLPSKDKPKESKP